MKLHPWASSVAGVAVAMLLMAGRIGLDRLFPGVDVLAQVQLRYLGIVVLTLGVLGVLVSRPKGPRRMGRSAGERIGLAVAFLYLCWMFASAAWAPAGAGVTAAIKDATLVLVGYLLITAAAWSADARRFMRGIVWGIIASGGVLGVIGVSGAMGDSPVRLAVLGGGPNIYGRLMALTALFLFAEWARGSGGPWLAGASVIAGMLVILSGSRGAMVALVVATIAYVGLERKHARRIAVGAILAAAMALGVIVATPIGDRVQVMYRARVTGLVVERLHTSGRDELYRVAISESLTRPWLGHGLGAFAHNEYSYPHNLLLESWHASGVAGLGLLVMALLCGATAVVRHPAGSDSELAAAVLLVLVAAQVSGDLYDSRAVFWLLPAVFMRRPHPAVPPAPAG